MSDPQEEVLKVLSQQQDNIPFEELPAEESSPLNQPVKEKDIAGPGQHREATKEMDNPTGQLSREDNVQETGSSQPFPDQDQQQEDAPEQEIAEDYNETDSFEEEIAEKEFELPTSHAKRAADTVLGMANNVLEVGGGYFIKIRKNKALFEFDEIIQVIVELLPFVGQ